MGRQASIIANITTASSGIATANTSAAFASTVKAMIAAPSTIKGERSSRRRVRFMPICTWFASLVMRVMRVEAPMTSVWAKERLFMCLKSASLMPRTNPALALAAKYCAATVLASPTTPRPTIKRHISAIYPPFPPSGLFIPLSIIFATTMGTSSSKEASSSLNTGAATASFL